MNSRLQRWLASIHYFDFIVGNGLAFLLFPVVCLVGTFFFFNNDLMSATLMGAFSLTHFAVLWSCLKAYGHAKRLRIPMLIAAAVVMFYNRHMDSWMDDSPFGGTLTMYDQQIIGLCGYLRVFDNPNEEFGSLEFDLAGLFVGVEVLVFVTFLLGVCLCVYDRLATVIRRSRRPTCFLPEEIPPPITAGDAAQ